MPPIETGFSPLETVLLSILVAVISSIGTFVGLGRKFITRAECEKNHDNVGLMDSQFTEKMNLLLKNQNLQFRMLKEIIIYMDLPKNITTKILNMKSN